MSWTDERIDRLKELWTQGMTASQIAEELGGVSRNAVIGKAHRLGLQSRPSPVKPNDPAAAAPAAAPAAPASAPSEDAPAPAAAAPAPAAEPAPWEEPAPKPQPQPRAKAQPQPEPEPEDGSDTAEAAPAAPAPKAPQPQIRSIGPGGFVRQAPGEQQSPIPPAPPRRLVPAKPSPEIADKTSLLDLNEKICKWPIGHPGEPDFHFCGNPANPGFPYCVQHCGVAYQAQIPRRDRRPPPPLPFGGPRVR
jgi:GcrA cell cycle regulator